MKINIQFFFRSNGFTLQQALDILFEIEDDHQYYVEDIFIELPEVNILTDEDSGKEDGGGAIDNLAGRQLLAPVEIRFENNDRIGGLSDVETPNISTPINTIYSTPPVKKTKGSQKSQTSSSTLITIDDFILKNEK